MRRFWNAFVRLHVAVYRLTGGRLMGTMRGRPLLLLTTTGRKSGKRRTAALGYLRDDGAYVVIASAAGGHSNPAWYRNLESNPTAIIEVRKERLDVRAETATGEERARLWARITEVALGYQTYQEKTEREFPIVLLREAAS